MSYLSFYVLVYAICMGQVSSPNPVCTTMTVGQFRSKQACEMEKAEKLKRYKVKPKFYCIESSTNN